MQMGKDKKGFGQWLLDAASWLGNAISTPAQTSAKNAQTVVGALTKKDKGSTPSSSAGTIGTKPAYVESGMVDGPVLSYGVPTDTTPVFEQTTTGTSAVDDANKTYEKYLTDQKTSAEDAANKRYDTDVIDAERRYERSRADYGAQVEKLRELGIDDSGYADYLNDRAYAQMISEIQAAKGRQADAMQTAEKEYKDLYAQYLLNKTTQEAALKAEEEAQAEDEKANLEATILGKYLFGNEGGAYDSLDAAKKKLETARATFGANSSQYGTAKKEFDEKYGIRVDQDYYTPGGDGTSVIGVDETEFSNAGDGDKISVWNGSEKIKVKKGGVQSGDVVQAFNNSGMSDEVPIVFEFRGAVYVAYNGNVYAIKSGEKEYDDLYKYLTDENASGYYQKH